MKLTEFMTCWRECVPNEFPIDLEQLKVNDFWFLKLKKSLFRFLGFCVDF